MSRKKQEINFINTFVDAVTVRPFLEGLRRVKRTSTRYAMPPVGRAPVATSEAA